MAYQIEISEISSDWGSSRANFLYDPNIATIRVKDTDTNTYMNIRKVTINQNWKYESNGHQVMRIDINPILMQMANKYSTPKFSIDRKGLHETPPVEPYETNFFIEISAEFENGQNIETAQRFYQLNKNLYGFRNWKADINTAPKLIDQTEIILPTGMTESDIKMYVKSNDVIPKVLTIWTATAVFIEFHKQKYEVEPESLINVETKWDTIYGIDEDNVKFIILKSAKFVNIDDDCIMLYFQTDSGTIEQLPFKQVSEQEKIGKTKDIYIGNPMRMVYDLTEMDLTIYDNKPITKEIKIGKKIADDVDRILLKQLMRSANIWIEYPDGLTRKVSIKEKLIPEMINDIELTLEQIEKNFDK